MKTAGTSTYAINDASTTDLAFYSKTQTHVVVYESNV